MMTDKAQKKRMTDEALKFYQKGLDVSQRLVDAHPKDAQARQQPFRLVQQPRQGPHATRQDGPGGGVLQVVSGPLREAGRGRLQRCGG